MSITAAQVKELRDKTGAGMMDAKNALTEAQGDMEKAQELLRQKGLATAAKKSGRAAAEGVVIANIFNNGQAGVLLEVNCETDFVGKGEAFLALANNLVQHATEKTPADLDVFLDQPYLHNNSQTVRDTITEAIGSIKENLSLRRYVAYNRTEPGLVHAYIHTGSKIGVLAELSFGNAATAQNDSVKALAKDICMQIASAGADFVSRNDIPSAVVEEETRIEMGKEDLQNKPEEVRAKIVKGRVDKLMGQRVLIEQPFVKDPSLTIEALLDNLSKQIGDTIAVVRFTRFVLGEGIEKVQANFAEEVMAQLR